MDLSPKAIRFIVEALEHYRDEHDRRLDSDTLTDDDRSDLANDRQFLNELVSDIRRQEPAQFARPT